ncbi:hypothetical protein [Enterococcus hermanniensis]|uniref:Uncharacterized protein n=1 Tax=Enterococcus hermanniensis TaxID=249189 RepID=A0A1L8TNF8_9ENTE|nr:hypothetical protein [Enterococcus hermanniensis]OJG45846.1 hypothetical protein RV04_GL001612 [Enterococcus hermanniensis]
MSKLEEVKEMVTDTVTKIYNTVKDNSIEITKEEKKLAPRIRTLRPTRHTIKWKAKNH